TPAPQPDPAASWDVAGAQGFVQAHAPGHGHPPDLSDDADATPPAPGAEGVADGDEPVRDTDPDEAPSHRKGAGLRRKREARFGLAALLSFLILVGVLVVKKIQDRAKPAGEGAAQAQAGPGSGKIPPTAMIGTGAGAGAIASASAGGR